VGNDFYVITVFFNPAGFHSLLNNYFIFRDQLRKQKVNLITVECAFEDGPFYIPEGEGVYRLRSNSIMWQKERLINYGVSQLPDECKYYAWIDCDVLFPVDSWADMAVEKLQSANIIQLFKKVHYMPQGMLQYDGSKMLSMQSVIWQYKIHKNWLSRRCRGELPFSVPGFAWACRKDTFNNINGSDGIYDRNIVGSGDTFLVDCYLDSWDIHSFAKKFNVNMQKDLMSWCSGLKKKEIALDYLPLDIAHLWHGSLKNRKYTDRHDIILNHDYNPLLDIELRNNVYEWATPKHEMHSDIKQYFFDRHEDDQ
jgi:hypothetical protein